MTRIEVQDFGPIANASVDLKPLTVFVGPNNSGKSYLALVLYSLARTLSGESRVTGPNRSRGHIPRRLELPEHELELAVAAAKTAWPTPKALPSRLLNIGEFPVAIQSLFASALKAHAGSLSFSFGRELQRCFGSEIRGLARRGSVALGTDFRVSILNDAFPDHWEMRSSEDEVVTTRWDAQISQLSVEPRRRLPSWRMFLDDPEYYLQIAAGQLSRIMTFEQPSRAHYMPASRSGILLGHKTIVSMIVERSSWAWLEPLEIPRLPGVVTDLIQALLLLEPARRGEDGIQEVAAFLEGRVTDGTVDMDRVGEYPEIYYEDPSGRYRLHQVSSMVSEIAPIVLYLKYLVQPGHLFIIEEPESHIDAESQLNLARAIAMLVNAGVKVLLTTHSDYFVKQINNLLLLSELSPRRRAARRYRREEVLNPDQVGAYLFRPTDDGTEVESMAVTASGGIPVDTFTDVHGALYDEAVTLEYAEKS